MAVFNSSDSALWGRLCLMLNSKQLIHSPRDLFSIHCREKWICTCFVKWFESTSILIGVGEPSHYKSTVQLLDDGLRKHCQIHILQLIGIPIITHSIEICIEIPKAQNEIASLWCLWFLTLEPNLPMNTIPAQN